MTECVRPILQRNEAETFRRVKPFNRCPLRTEAGAGALMFKISHDVIAAPLCRERALPECPSGTILRLIWPLRQDAALAGSQLRAGGGGRNEGSDSLACLTPGR